MIFFVTPYMVAGNGRFVYRWLNSTSRYVQWKSTHLRPRGLSGCEEATKAITRAELAGWYCRTGCVIKKKFMKKYHFGDEISLSSSAPNFSTRRFWGQWTAGWWTKILWGSIYFDLFILLANSYRLYRNLDDQFTKCKIQITRCKKNL